MADHQALREADALVALAAELLARLEREIASLYASQRLAAESLAQVTATAGAGAAVVSTLEKALSEGRQLERQAARELDAGARVQSALSDMTTPAAPSAFPALASAGIEDVDAARLSGAVLPVFAVPSREELWQGETAASPHAEMWDAFAQGIKTLEDLQADALAQLVAADRQLDEVERTFRRNQTALPERKEREHGR